MRVWAILAVLACTVSAPALAAPELVTNGGFETGDFTGWTLFGDTSYVGVAGRASAPEKTIGNYRAFFGSVDVGGIVQSLATTAGQAYTISFYLNNDGLTPNSADIRFGGTTLLSLTNAPAFDLTRFSFTAVASGASTDLRFGFSSPPAYFNLDGVSVSAAAVPEASSWAMMVAGFGLAGAALRRRRTAVAFA